MDEQSTLSTKAILVTLFPIYSTTLLSSLLLIKIIGLKNFCIGIYLLLGAFGIPATMLLVYRETR